MSTAKILTIIAAVILGIPLLLLSAFVAWGYHWTTRYSSYSPDGTREIRVQTRACLEDCVLRITAHQGVSTATLTEKADCYFEIGHVTWVGKIGVIYVPDGLCGNFNLAYDFETRRAIDSTPFEVTLRDDVRRTYSVTPQELLDCEGDILKWMNRHEPCVNNRQHRALTEFRRRHPR